MLKRTLVFLILLMMTYAAATAEEALEHTDNGPLTLEELQLWSQSSLERALGQQPLSAPGLTEDGYRFDYDFATLYLDVDTPSADAHVLSVELTAYEAEGPRGTQVGMLAEEILAAYPLANPTLAGSREEAVLYLDSRMPEGIRWGIARRDGQRLTQLQYTASDLLASGDEYADAGISYEIDEGVVTSIRVWGLDDRMQEEELYTREVDVQALMQQADYSQAASSLSGGKPEAFGLHDLAFSGLTFDSLSSAEAQEALGGVLDESWLEDGEGYIHVMTFATCEVTALCDADRAHAKTEMLTIFSDELDGPRGIRVGDTLAQVRSRFPQEGDGTIDDAGIETLYGAAGEASWGHAEYGADGNSVLRYVCRDAEGRNVTLMCRFDAIYLSEIMLFVGD